MGVFLTRTPTSWVVVTFYVASKQDDTGTVDGRNPAPPKKPRNDSILL